MIDGLLAHNAVPQVPGPLVALICPHAGYMFTGPVAAACFAQLKGRKYTRVVVIAPSHFENFHFSSIYDGDAYATPLGNVPVDQDFRAKLAKLSSTIKISDRGHLKVGENAEHALEVQLPWLQRTLGDFKLVPIIMGDQDYGLERALGRALAKALLAEAPEARAQTLILVSSDLSHYTPTTTRTDRPSDAPGHRGLGLPQPVAQFRHVAARYSDLGSMRGGPIVAA